MYGCGRSIAEIGPNPWDFQAFSEIEKRLTADVQQHLCAKLVRIAFILLMGVAGLVSQTWHRLPARFVATPSLEW